MNYMAIYRRHDGKGVADHVTADSIVDWLPDDCTSVNMSTGLDVWEICRLEVGQKYTDISGFVWERVA